jgi:hypothetical protein
VVLPKAVRFDELQLADEVQKFAVFELTLMVVTAGVGDAVAAPPDCIELQL